MPEFKPEILKQLWEHLSQESPQPERLLEEWVNEVAEWGRLSDYQEKLHREESLWLPTNNKAELEVLWGLGALSNTLKRSPFQLVQALLEPHVSLKQDNTELLPQAPANLPNTIVGDLGVALVKVSPEVQSLSQNAPTQSNNPIVNAEPEYHTLILEALTDFQATFELALEQTASQPTQQTLPVEELEDYLTELLDFIKNILAHNRIVHEQ